MISLVIKTIFSFSVVVILMFGFLYVLRKFYLKIPNPSSLSMKIYARLQIQPKKSIYIVKILNKVLILGVAENSISILSEISDPEMIRILDELEIKQGGAF
ncbi:flagellar protein FliO/FliZ [Candidatus Thermokryptus mobilis]|uniref:Flagellar protein FliO/FliZ n=1 Tax=Candidatus Thermokryptus mobilis TaxID=1643428 RepID=A0A0S4N7L9_9BACT|nr:flagellar biosynthetic protein FliO [Candidatus Thermokryptus mobilis]CUU06627.1 flagellar protein FliO/FliZ [Candidatus Thermokryptus mobilis]